MPTSTMAPDSFYVLEGEVEFLVNGKWRRGVVQARVLLGPRPGVEHGFRIAGEHPNPRAQRSRAERSLRRRNAIALKTETRRLGI